MSNSGEPEPQSRHGSPIVPSLYLDGALRLVYEVAALVVVQFASSDWVSTRRQQWQEDSGEVEISAHTGGS
jgi:hypothetical protein